MRVLQKKNDILQTKKKENDKIVRTIRTTTSCII